MFAQKKGAAENYYYNCSHEVRFVSDIACSCLHADQTETNDKDGGKEGERARDEGTEGLEDKEQRGKFLHVSTITHCDMHARP